MGHLLDGRRREIRAKGRMATLTRGDQSVDLVMFPRGYRPDELTGAGSGGVMLGDLAAHTLNDEIVAANWPAPPAKPDTVILDGQRYTVMAAWRIFEGSLLIGWKLWLRAA